MVDEVVGINFLYSLEFVFDDALVSSFCIVYR